MSKMCPTRIPRGLVFQLTDYRNVGSPVQAVSFYKLHHNYVEFHFCSIQDSLPCLKHIRSDSQMVKTLNVS